MRNGDILLPDGIAIPVQRELQQRLHLAVRCRAVWYISRRDTTLEPLLRMHHRPFIHHVPGVLQVEVAVVVVACSSHKSRHVENSSLHYQFQCLHVPALDGLKTATLAWSRDIPSACSIGYINTLRLLDSHSHEVCTLARICQPCLNFPPSTTLRIIRRRSDDHRWTDPSRHTFDRENTAGHINPYFHTLVSGRS